MVRQLMAHAALRRLSAGITFGQYVLVRDRPLGRGNFGAVYAGAHRSTGAPVAIKLVPETAARAAQMLHVESSVYQALDGTPGFSSLYWHGRAHAHHAIVLDRLGPSLRSLHRISGLRLNGANVRSVGEHTLHRLAALHDIGYVHCDVKPANLLLATNAPTLSLQQLAEQPIATTLHCIDFGLARRWWSAEHEHVPRRRLGAAVGTGRFASLQNHEGLEPIGRRDDLEALALTMVYLACGELPWSGIDAPTKAERFAQMLLIKRQTRPADLGSLFGGNALAQFIEVVRALRHDERPPYEALLTLVRQMHASNNCPSPTLPQGRRTGPGQPRRTALNASIHSPLRF